MQSQHSLWGPVWHFPRVPAGKPGGTSQEGSVLPEGHPISSYTCFMLAGKKLEYYMI